MLSCRALWKVIINLIIPQNIRRWRADCLVQGNEVFSWYPLGFLDNIFF